MAARNTQSLARREHYELRMTAILRHHEIFLYKRLCRENGIELNTARPNDPKPISEILAQCKPDDILSQESVIAANDALSRAEQDLRTSRDEWIKLYTGATSCALP